MAEATVYRLSVTAEDRKNKSARQSDEAWRGFPEARLSVADLVNRARTGFGPEYSSDNAGDGPGGWGKSPNGRGSAAGAHGGRATSPKCRGAAKMEGTLRPGKRGAENGEMAKWLALAMAKAKVFTRQKGDRAGALSKAREQRQRHSRRKPALRPGLRGLE